MKKKKGKLRQKLPYFGIFGLKFEKKLSVLFEISIFASASLKWPKFMKYEFLTNKVHIGIGSAFSIFPGSGSESVLYICQSTVSVSLKYNQNTWFTKVDVSVSHNKSIFKPLEVIFRLNKSYLHSVTDLRAKYIYIYIHIYIYIYII